MQELPIHPSTEFKTNISPFNWRVYYLEWMTPCLRQYLYKIPLPQPEKCFIEGLCFQYGIDVEENQENAIKKYSMAALGNHPIAMFKLAQIQLIEWKNGERADKDEEMYLRFRSFAYLGPNQDPKGLDIKLEIARYMREYDPKRVKLGELFARLETRKDPIDLAYIKAKIGLMALDYEEINQAVQLLGTLVSKYWHNDAAYTLALLLSQSNGIVQNSTINAAQYYRICQNSKYYKSFNSIGQFFLSIGQRKQALTSFQHACDYGYYQTLNNLLSLSFYDLDKTNQLYKLITAYIPSIITGSSFNILNIFHIRCLSKLDPQYYNQEHDMIQRQLVVTIKEMYQYQRLKQIKNKDQFVMAYVLIVSLGYITKDYDQQDILIDEAYHESQTVWLKRYCITNLMEVRRKRYLEEPTNPRLQVLNKTGITLADEHLKQLNNDQTPSFFYCLAQIYLNGWGVQKSNVNYYLFLCKAAQWTDIQVIGNLFLQYYKANQAKQQLSKITELPQLAPLCKKIKDNLNENKTCDICYQKTKEAFFHECQHYCCLMCYNVMIKEKGNCHMCRKPIKSVHLLKNIMKFE